MRRFAGVAALAAGLVMTTTSTGAAAAATPTDDSVRASTPVAERAPDKAKDEKGESSADECVSRAEYRRLDATGKNASSARQARRIVGYHGRRETRSRAFGHRWEIRKYLRCNSEVLHVYVNYRDGTAYRKAW